MRILKITGFIVAGLTALLVVFDSPSVRPDREGIAKAQVQQQLDKHKDEFKQKAQEQLKGLFGR
jgi:acid phosphatase family membrane protein YuiD